MKRIVNFFAAFAALLLSAACQKGQEILPENVVNISVLSSKEDNPEDSFKTYIGENSFTGAVEAKWGGSDEIMLYEYVDNVLTQSASSNSTEVTDGNRIARFSIPLDITKPTGETYIYEAVYPKSAVSQGGSTGSQFDRVSIPQNQTAAFITDDFTGAVIDPFTANIDPAADVLIGSPISRTARPVESDLLSFSFKRIGTVGKLVLKNLGAAETVKSVEISMPDGKVTGFSKIDVKTGTISEAGYSTKESVKISIPNEGYNSMVTYEGIPCNVYFRCLSGTWAEGTEVTVKVETSAAIYTKTTALPRDYEFIEGGLTSFAFNMATADRQAISTDDFSGEWMIVGENSGTLYAMSAYESGNNIKAVEYTLTPEGKATSEDGLDNCCYTITKITEGGYSGYYTIQDVNSLFLYAAGGSSSNYLKGAVSIPTSSADAYYWDITCISGAYSIKAKSSGRNTMQFNSSNILFACYDGATQKAVSLFPWDDVVVDTTPVITVSSTELALNADGTIQGEEITVSGNKYLTGAITATSSDESWLLASVEDGKLVVAADENTGDERTATVTLSYTGADDVIVNVSQSKAGILMSVIDFESEVSAYPDWNFVNMTSAQSGTITAHGGSKYGATASAATASITTKSKINPESIVFYVSKQSTNTTASSWIVQTSVNGSSWTDVSTQSATSMTKGEWVEVDVDLKSYSDVYVRVSYSGSTAVRNMDDLTLAYTEVKTPNVSSVAVSGTPSKTEYLAGENFETAGLTVTATFEDASTKDVTDEVEWTITPSGALAAGTTSVSVVATYKSVASEAYTVNGLTVTEPQALSTIQDVFDAATSTEANAKVKFGNWVVSGVKGSNAYVTDGTKGLIIYQSGHGFEVGDILSGTVDCELVVYQGSAELKGVSSSTTGLTVTKGGVITPATIAISDLSGVNTGAVISFESLSYNGSAFSDGTNTITPYGTFITLPTLISGRNYQVTGVYIQYGTTKEIAPRAAEDFELLPAPTYGISFSSMTNGEVTADVTEAAEGQTVTLTVTPASGYELDELTVTDASSHAVTVSDNKFTMPASAVTVSATFKESGGTDKSVTWTATSGGLGSGIGEGTIETEEFSWNYTRTLISGSSYTGWTSSCIQLGKNGGVENLTLSTSNIPGTIKSVSVECSSYNNAHKVSISVGGTTYKSSTSTAKWTTVSAVTGTGTSSGEIVISFTDGTRALYIKSISVTYNN